MQRLEERVLEIASTQKKQQDLWLAFVVAVDVYVNKKEEIWEDIHPAILFVQTKLQNKFLWEAELPNTELAMWVLKLMNEERQKLGLGVLKFNAVLAKSAELHWEYLTNGEHFSHNQDMWDGECVKEEAAFQSAIVKWLKPQDIPVWGQRIDDKCYILTERLEEVNYARGFAGENLAMGQRTAVSVMTDWMNSPDHKRNILDPDFKEVWIVYLPKKNIWVQNFGTLINSNQIVLE